MLCEILQLCLILCGFIVQRGFFEWDCRIIGFCIGSLIIRDNALWNFVIIFNSLWIYRGARDFWVKLLDIFYFKGDSLFSSFFRNFIEEELKVRTDNQGWCNGQIYVFKQILEYREILDISRVEIIDIRVLF